MQGTFFNQSNLFTRLAIVREELLVLEQLGSNAPEHELDLGSNLDGDKGQGVGWDTGGNVTPHIFVIQLEILANKSF